jgi:hypothetical protein
MVASEEFYPAIANEVNPAITGVSDMREFIGEDQDSTSRPHPATMPIMIGALQD